MLGLLLLAALLPTGWVLYRTRSLRARLAECCKRVEQGEGPAVLPVLRRLAERHYDDLAIRHCLAKALFQAGLLREAIREFELLALGNQRMRLLSDVDLADQLAACYLETDRPVDAQGVLMMALRRHPENPLLLARAALAAERRGEPRRAAEYLAAALSRESNDPALWLRLSGLEERGANPRGALDAALRALQAAPEDGRVLQRVASLYQAAGRLREAAEHYERLSGLAGWTAVGLSGRADCLLSLGSRDEARAGFERAAKAAAGDPDVQLPALYRLAMLAIGDLDIRTGMRHLERIEEVRADYRDVASQLARFRDFSSNERLGAFAFSSNERFPDLAEQVMLGMGITPYKRKIVRKRDFVFYGVMEDREYKENIYIYFSRSLNPLEEWELRELFSERRVVRMSRGLVFSLGDFTPEARRYAAGRSFALIGRNELAGMLTTVRVSAA